MSRLGNLYRAGLLVTVPLMLQACGGGEITEADIAELDTTTFDELRACKTSQNEFSQFDSSCEGRTGVFYALITDDYSRRYQVKPSSCDDEDQVTAEHSLGGFFEESDLSEFDAIKKQKAMLPKCVKAVWRIDGLEGLRPLHLLWQESDEEKATREARAKAKKQAEQEAQRLEQERLAKEEAERKRREKEAELNKHKNDAAWMANKYTIIATSGCQKAVENLAKYDFEWTDGWLDMKFPSYLSNVTAPYVVTITGDKVKFQNGFGAWQKHTYYCDYNVKTGKVVNAYVR